MSKHINHVSPRIGMDVKATIDMLNEAAISAILNCATSGDPLAHLVLGCDREVLAEMRTIPKGDFLKSARLGSISLVKLRFTNAATWRALRVGGFSNEQVLRELQREPGFQGPY